MHEPANILSLRYTNPAVAHASRTSTQLTFCYQCHCAVDLGVTKTALRSGHWARIGTCAHCGTTITRILKVS
jgi:predicted SprT family Zn-dependent metalloprotease